MQNLLDNIKSSQQKTKENKDKQKKLVIQTTNEKIVNELITKKNRKQNVSQAESIATVVWTTVKGIFFIVVSIYFSLNMQFLIDCGTIIKDKNLKLDLIDIFFPSNEQSYPYNGTLKEYKLESCDCNTCDFNFKSNLFSKIHGCIGNNCPGWPYNKCTLPTCTSSLFDFFKIIFIDSYYNGELLYNKSIAFLIDLLDIKNLKGLPVFIFYPLLLFILVIALAYILPIGLTILEIITFIQNLDLWNWFLIGKLLFVWWILAIIFLVANVLYSIWKIILLLFRLCIEPSLIGGNIGSYYSKHMIAIWLIIGIYVMVQLVLYSYNN